MTFDAPSVQSGVPTLALGGVFDSFPSLMPRGIAEDDRVPAQTKNPYFLENYFAIFRNPPTPNALKLMKSRKFKFFTNLQISWKNIEIPINFHQNHCEKRRIWRPFANFGEIPVQNMKVLGEL